MDRLWSGLKHLDAVLHQVSRADDVRASTATFRTPIRDVLEITTVPLPEHDYDRRCLTAVRAGQPAARDR